MAINKKLIHFQTLANFEAQLSAGNILDTSICFIKDANKIWTHGQFYDCDVQIMNDGGDGRVVLGHNNQTIYPYTLASQVQAGASDLDTYLNNLADVATTGSYNDLKNKPTIPSAVTESTVSGWGFTKNTGTYSKPSTGIPKTDLASGVQSSLEKADKAQPTLVSGTNIKTINGESILGSGDISISGGTADLSNVVQYNEDGQAVIQNGTISDGHVGILYALPSAKALDKGEADYVIATDVDLKKKQNTITDLETIRQGAAKGATALQSYTEQYKGTVTGVKINGTTKNPSSGVVDLGTVITAHQTLKTINGESIVGSGDITISGGSSDANVQAVDTGDVLDDITVEYVTKAYFDSVVGNINGILESIITGWWLWRQ